MMLNFPRGRSGLGLLILRVSAAVIIIVLESDQQSMGGAASFLSFAAIVFAILMALGLFTSVSSATVALLVVTLFFVSHSELMTRTTIAALSASLSLMGGGAYSVDGLIHGRRRIFVPRPQP
jgi:hypothetical protein